MRWTILLALLPSLTLAQTQPTSRPEDLGTVTGHITCSDTQRPARLAQVDLVPIKSAEDSDPDASFKNFGKYGPVHTDTNGAYSLTDVPPGQYYLRVSLDGYITPISQFTAVELHTPTPQVQQRIQHELQFVTVTPNSTTRADATLRRAASISGKVIYDDGSPAIGLDVTCLFPDAKGHFHGFGNFHTDSHGRYSMDSLSAGRYIIQVILRAMERRPGSVTFADLRSKAVLLDGPVFSLPIYSGSVFREKDAAIIKVDEGQESDGIDITIPLGRLHEISGTLFAKDGHAINNGRVDLLFADTQEPFTVTDVRDNGTFDLRFIPDGSYIIKVTDASDYETIDVPATVSPGSPTPVNRRSIRSYGDLQQPLTVQTSDQSLTLTLPDKPSASVANSTGTN